MADTKITALTAITTVDPAADVLPIVDVSDTSMAASGTTKKITSNQILGAGGTATLASATITGDLTVDTSTLKVDSANNRVGIGTATPVSSLQVLDGDITVTTGGSFSGFNGTRQTVPPSVGTQLSRLHFSAYSTGTTYVQGASIQSYSDAAWSASSAPAYLAFYTTPSASVTLSERYRIASDGVATWSNVGGVAGTAMTLNSTGLGVGVSPAYQIHTRKDQAAFTTVAIDNHNAIAAGTGTQFLLIDGGTNAGWFRRNRDGTGNTDIGYKDTLRFRGQIAGTERTDLTIDTSGNVGIGVTSSASHILSCAGPIGISGTNSGTRTSYISNSGVCSIYYTDGGGSGFFADFGNLIIQPRTSAARSVVIATGSTTPVERAVVKSTGQVRFVPLAADPAGAEAGDVYYNSTSNKLKCYNGTTWNDLF